MADLYLYFSTVFWKWVGLTMAIDAALALFNRFTALEVSRKVFVGVTMIGIFIAGYQAWSDERAEHLTSQKELSMARERIASLEAQPRIGEEAKAQIDSLTQTNQQLQQKVTALEQQSLPRILTDEQKKKLTEALSKVPLGSNYRLLFLAISGCEECSGYMEELWTIWSKAPGWKVLRTTTSDTIPGAIGLFVPVGKEGCPSEELHLVMSALDVTGIQYGQGSTNVVLGSGPGCYVLVGRKPPQ